MSTTTPTSVKLDTRFHWVGLVGAVALCLVMPWSKLRSFLWRPEYRAMVLSSWAIIPFVLMILLLFAGLYVMGYLPILASRVTLVEEGVEVETRFGTRVYQWSQVRSITCDRKDPIYEVRFRNFRRVTLTQAGDFVTELSARTGVPILPPRFG